MSSGLYSGVSGFALGTGLYKGVNGLWGGASGLINGFGGEAFSPASLFAAGEPGAWYDPSDLTTMFQDTAGTTPVTATGQTVGLLLDKSQGLVLGPELVTNGDFSSATGWTLSGSASIGAGELSLPAGSDARQTIGIVAGQSYEVTIVRGGSAILVVLLGALGSGGLSSFQINTAGTYRFVLNAAGSSPGLLRINNVSGAATGTVDNISVKLLPGNHATQATAASRPIYGIEPFGGRRNLLTFTEQFDNAAWVLQAAGTGVAPTRTLGAGTSPAGVTACRLQFSLGGGTSTADQSIFRQSATVPSGAGVFSVWLRSNDGVSSYVMQLTDPTGNGQNITVTGSWQRFQVTGTSVGTAVNYQLRLRGGQSPANSNTADVLFSEPLVETGSTATAYQRVTDQWNVTQAGVASVSYLAFDGTDDSMLTGTITPGIDKAQVFAGVRKLSDVASGVLCEFSAGSGSGRFEMFAPLGAASPNYQFSSRGTAGPSITATPFAAPTTNVVTSIGDIAGDVATLRVNGVQAATSATDQGSGNYLAYPLYIGRRAGTANPFNGRIYSLIVRFGANLAAGTITQTETWVGGETGVYTLDQLNLFATLDASGASYNAYGAADADSNYYLVPKTVLDADGTPYSVL